MDETEGKMKEEANIVLKNEKIEKKEEQKKGCCS